MMKGNDNSMYRKIIKKLFFAGFICSLLILCIYILSVNEKNNQYQENSQFLRLINILNLGKGYASSSINISKFRRNAVIKVPEGRVTSFYDKNGQVKVILIANNGETRKIKITPNISEKLLGDGHCVISMGYKNGEVHVIYGAHVTAPYYVKFNISEFEQSDNKVIKADKWTEILTYPQFYSINNKLYLVYRNSGIRMICFDEDSNSWDFNNSIYLFDSGEYDSVYIHDLAIKDNLIAIPYMFRLKNDGSNLVKNDGIYLVYSDDFGKTFKDLRGNLINLPIIKDGTDKIVEVGIEDSLMNQDGSTFSKDGVLYFTHMNKTEKGIPQIHITTVNFEEQKILTTEVSKNRKEFSLEGKGTLSLPLSRAGIAVSDSLIHVIYRQDEDMIIATAKRDAKGFPEGDWEYYRPDSQPLGVWEPNYDIEEWKRNEHLIIFIQRVRQGEEDRAVRNKASDVFLYEFGYF